MIHLIGAPGAGKSYVRAALATRLGGVKTTGIDDIRKSLREPGEPEWPPMHDNLAWWRLSKSVRSAPTVILETYGTNHREVGLLRDLRVLTVLVECDSMVRYRRLRVRNPDSWDALISMPTPAVGYDLLWDGGQPPRGPAWDALVARIQGFLTAPIRFGA